MVTSSTTLTEEVYRQLKTMIVTSELLPGTTLQEVALSERMKVSRTPVREALRLLESEGLVEFQSYRGARVSQISRQDVMDAYEARLWVEPSAAAKAALHADDETLARLAAVVDRMPAEPGTHEEAAVVVQADVEFHDLIIEAAGNRLIRQLIEECRSITRRAAYFVPPGRYSQSRREHHAILEALVARDPDKAADLMHTHIINARNRMFGDR